MVRDFHRYPLLRHLHHLLLRRRPQRMTEVPRCLNLMLQKMLVVECWMVQVVIVTQGVSKQRALKLQVVMLGSLIVQKPRK